MKCPNCGLINPDSALRCDCGYDFTAQEIKESYLPPKKIQNQEPPPDGLNLPQQLWHGYVPLAWTSWLFGVVGGIPVSGLFGFAAFFIDSKDDVLLQFFQLMVVLLFLAYHLVVFVAIWRSASRYQGPPVWKHPAKIWVVFGWMNVSTGLAKGLGQM